jgi:predicted dehydrogenase
MSERPTRRSFLAGGLLVLASPRAARAFRAAERLRLAVFGNMYNASHFLTAVHTYNASIEVWCNPDRRKIPAVLKQWEDQAAKLAGSRNADDARAAEQYRRMARKEGVEFADDIRQVFARMADRIDALVVSDYDHFHGVACGAALRAGKPVCSERPLGLNIGDARRLRALAAETKLPAVYRSPGTGTNAFRRSMELVRDGALGTVKEVHVWFKRGGPDAEAVPKGPQPVPEGLNWDLWLAPLAWREYHPDWMSYAHWRETCSGGLGSFGPHTSIFPFLALGLRELWDAPGASIRVQAECSRRNAVSFPRWERVRWDLPARKDFPPATITWHHGPEYAPGARDRIHGKLRAFGVEKPEEADALMKNAGSLLVGSEGALVADDHSANVVALPRDRFGKEPGRPQRIPESRGIYRDWIDACRGQKPHLLDSFDHGGPLSEMLMLGNLATLVPGETLSYDPAAGQLAGPDEARQRMDFKYRDGWKL